MATTITDKGQWSKTFKWLDNILEQKYVNILDRYGKMGVEELRKWTPRDSGKTADSWEYEIIGKKKDKYKEYSIVFYNTNVISNRRYKVNVAVLLQYGHATKDGRMIEGVDYINPALEPIFDRLAAAAWEEVTKA